MSNEDFEKTKKMLAEINAVVIGMDPSIRPATFEILVSRYLGSPGAGASITPKAKVKETDSSDEAPDTTDLGAFINSFDTKKPADAVMVLVAWLYSNYGAYAISIKELKELADSCGLTVPARVDMTLRQGKSGGKSLFVQQNKSWKPTVSGEIFLKDTYKISKGTKSLPQE
ncbi:hypothetical protein HDE76_003656 [Rhodanobacter sp. ANJX3]|uniref:hypothetical protein n=1 Tax=Rhodanobacter sp. ANJX3 TaxID=2723083 RepID=UPI001622EE5C|nr:hypothetical protein [Rhodanobacter sp. ANJX3]MBB5360412.1 hypothetical protein [Rhodanobacter sp. ANJX3]